MRQLHCTDSTTGTERYTLSGDTKLRIYACKYRQVEYTDVITHCMLICGAQSGD